MAATPSSVSARPEVTICTQCGSSFNLVQCEPFGRVRADEYAAEQGRFDRYTMTVPAAANREFPPRRRSRKLAQFAHRQPCDCVMRLQAKYRVRHLTCTFAQIWGHVRVTDYARQCVEEEASNE
jgi:hypothetical protein